MTLTTIDDSPPCLAYEPYSFQVAGHMFSEEKSENKNFLRCTRDKCLLKPMQPSQKSRAESQFYRAVWHDGHSELASLRPLVPRYYGITVVRQKSEDTEYLKLEDLLSDYRNPSVMDVKMGCQTWTESSTAAKIVREKVKFPHGEALGFRLLGMKVFSPEHNNYSVKGKTWGRDLSEATVHSAFDEFFNRRDPAEVVPIVRLLTSRLCHIRRWFEAQRQLAFCRSSILLMYDWPGTGAAPRADARMIDFAHVVPSSQPDQNYLQGLRNLIDQLESYAETTTKKPIESDR